MGAPIVMAVSIAEAMENITFQVQIIATFLWRHISLNALSQIKSIGYSMGYRLNRKGCRLNFP